MLNALRPLLLAILLSAPSGYAFAQILPSPSDEGLGSQKPDKVPGQILFKMEAAHRDYCQDKAISIQGFSTYLDALGSWELKRNFPNLSQVKAGKKHQVPDLDLIYELRISSDRNLDAAISYLGMHPAVAYAEPRYIYEVFYMPNDPQADTVFNQDPQWYLTTVKAREAWDIQKGDTAVIIGITDSGISYEHPELTENLLLNLNDPIDGIDNDLDGYLDNYRGWDFGGKSLFGVGDNDASYVSNHGVSVTGIPAARADNRFGTAGAAFNCRYLPLKSGPDNIPGAITHGYESILYAAQKGAQVINCSWGGQVRSLYGEDVVEYVTEVYQAAIVAACGNTPQDLRFYPAAYPSVLSVTNVHQQDSLCCPQYASPPGQALGTSYNHTVDVAAPGWRLLTPTSNSNFHFFSGTSAASPLAAAVVAITKAHFPGYTGFQAAQRVRVTTDDVYQNPYNKPFQDKMGTGRVNMYRALTDPLKPAIRHQSYQLVNSQGGKVFAPGDTLWLTGEFINHLDPSTPNLLLQVEILDSLQSSHIEIIKRDYQPGSIQSLEQFDNKQSAFLLKVGAGTPENLMVNLRLRYRDTALLYDDFEILEFRANATMIDITENLFHTSLNSRGKFGFDDFPANQIGLGVQYDGDERGALFEGAFLVGRADSLLADNARDPNGITLEDFSVRSLIRPITSGKADFVAAGEFDDSQANSPLGLRIEQRAYAWKQSPDEDYIILEYKLHNEGNVSLSGLHAGLMADWDIIDPSTDACSYDPLSDLLFAYDVDGFDAHYYGMSLLSNDPLRASAFEIGDMDFSKSAKFDAISNIPTGGSASAGLSGTGADIVHFLAAGPFSLAPGDSHTVAFALMAGNSFQDVRNISKVASDKYRCDVLEEGPTQGFSISANPAIQNQAVQFNDLNNQTSSWAWDFGDGTTSTLQNPSHSYMSPGTYTVSFFASDGSCTIARSQQLRVSNSTALEEELLVGIEIFPNPSTGRLQLRFAEVWKSERKLELVNALGQVVMTQDAVNSPELSLELMHLSKGVYWLRVSSKEGEVGIPLQLE